MDKPFGNIMLIWTSFVLYSIIFFLSYYTPVEDSKIGIIGGSIMAVMGILACYLSAFDVFKECDCLDRDDDFKKWGLVISGTTMFFICILVFFTNIENNVTFGKALFVIYLICSFIYITIALDIRGIICGCNISSLKNCNQLDECTCIIPTTQPATESSSFLNNRRI